MAHNGGNGTDASAERRHPGDRADLYRSEYARDLDRILYSSAFRRLTGVTQVVSADETLLFHNRLTHTLKVAQIARRLSERLVHDYEEQLKEGPGLVPECAEAAALAHDLGHPPFGHIAEEVLRECCDAEDIGINGYEGNAQSFRIVTRLSWRAELPGLNLTQRTLRGILKYPWLRTGDNAGKSKWGAYESEASDFQWATGNAVGEPNSLEAQIMDWADDISYAVHDLEDFYRAGLTPIPQMHHDPLVEQQRFITRATKSLDKHERFDADTAARAFREILQMIAFERPYDGSNEARKRIHKAASVLITRFIGFTKLGPDNNLSISDDLWHEVNMLKQLTWHYVINSPDLATIQEGQKRTIRGLFDYLVEWALKESNRDRLPTRFRETLRSLRDDDEAKAVLADSPAKLAARAAADYIASLTESQALELYGRLFGTSRSSILHGWVRA